MILSIKTFSLVILFIFHIAGVILFSFNPKSAQLSFLTLLVCGTLILLHEKKGHNYFVYTTIILGGYLIEVIGVNSGQLFGNYSYGNALGFKLFNVPPLIGLNWLIIVISGASIARRFFKKKPIWIIAIVSAIICTSLDFIIEPVAIKFNFWQWQGGIIPIFNYACWLIFCFIFSLMYLHNKVHVNKIGMYTYGIWILFFTCLNII